ncbi:MAG: phosphate ABC transporter ATP-binding protein, partial [Chthoniobacterales bacterium]
MADATTIPVRPASAAPAPVPETPEHRTIISVRDFDFYYGKKQALKGINLDIPERQVTAFIGPSGCGKTTLLRNFNRMNELIDGVSHTGDITMAGRSLWDPSLEVIALRRLVGMVFQKSNPFAKSIYENVVYSLRVAGVRDRHTLDETVERSLRGAALWDEVKDRLHERALGLSGGQMQRL